MKKKLISFLASATSGGSQKPKRIGGNFRLQ